MIHAALASAAFLGESPETVLHNAVEAGVNGVEWSADGFLEPGDLHTAGELMMKTLRAGLCSVSYSSLYRFGVHGSDSFGRVLDTAAALHAPIVRVWTGSRSRYADLNDQHSQAYQDLRKAILGQADKAGELGISLCFGFAKGSILDSYEGAIRFFASLDHPFVKLVWEPLGACDFDTARQAFATLSGRIGLVMSRSADHLSCSRLLSDTAEDWLEYLDAFDEQGGSPDMVRHVLLRSFGNGDPARLTEDACHIAAWSRLLRRYHRRRVY